jgi:hypothetical protein
VRRIGFPFLGVFCLAAALLASEPALAARRVALVVGNSNYKNTVQLLNPANDAKDIAAKLRRLGFDEVIEGVDLDKSGWDRALVKFKKSVLGAEAALFFYAGHGMQFHGKNYLMPVDAQIEGETGRDPTSIEIDLDDQMIEVDEKVKKALALADKAVKIMILDACRNNPLARKLVLSRSTGEEVRGLARIAQAEGMVVAYATQANEVAQDGSGRNSPFTTALLKNLDEPGLEIGSLFRKVLSDVNENTKGQQRPELSISFGGEFYLNTSETAAMAWSRVRATTDPLVLRDFLARFPSSPQALDADYRLKMLEKAIADRKRDEEERIAKEAEAAELNARLARDDAQRKEAERQKLAEQEQERVAQAEETARLALELENLREAARKAELAKQDALAKAQAAEEAAKQIANATKDEKARLEQEHDAQLERAHQAESRMTAAQEKARIAKETAERRARDQAFEDLRKRAEAAEREKLEAQKKALDAEEAVKRVAAEAEQKEAERKRAEEARLQKQVEEAQRQKQAALTPTPAEPERTNGSSTPPKRAIEQGAKDIGEPGSSKENLCPKGKVGKGRTCVARHAPNKPEPKVATPKARVVVEAPRAGGSAAPKAVPQRVAPTKAGPSMNLGGVGM